MEYTDRELLDKAKEAMVYSYSPYSRFKVGACVLTKDGHIYTGCNIENSSFGATNCAVSTAIFKAVYDCHSVIFRFKDVSVWNMQAGYE